MTHSEILEFISKIKMDPKDKIELYTAVTQYGWACDDHATKRTMEIFNRALEKRS